MDAPTRSLRTAAGATLASVCAMGTAPAQTIAPAPAFSAERLEAQAAAQNAIAAARGD